MKATELKQKYRNEWDYVYSHVVDDLRDCMPGADVAQLNDKNTHCRIARIAHNAAFFACIILDRRLKTDNKV